MNSPLLCKEPKEPTDRSMKRTHRGGFPLFNGRLGSQRLQTEVHLIGQ